MQRSYNTSLKARRFILWADATTVYVKNGYHGKGIGCLLYNNLIDNLHQTKMSVDIGGIALPNEASVKLHEKMGFKNVGILKNVGRKFNRWIGVGYWELELKNILEYEPENHIKK